MPGHTLSEDSTLMIVWYVALGGAVGSVARFLFGEFLQQRSGLAFPIGTLVINISGSLLLGFILRYTLATLAISPEVRALIATGFCGGYTTFSSFSYETAALLEEGDLRRATLYIVLSVALSLVGTFAGLSLAGAVLNARRGF
ncbi:MAG TPA: fluoride efflux transporter CrcB [Gemmatimonadales bacterium]|nr:fluoride efflux transporter CrcB [Gemmatimonadales bacterium]